MAHTQDKPATNQQADDPALHQTRTSDVERQKQHDEAHGLLNLPYVALQDHGEIPLEWKQHPTQADETYSVVEHGGLRDETEGCFRCVSSRGYADVQDLVKIVQLGHDCDDKDVRLTSNSVSDADTIDIKDLNLWSDEVASQYNVCITRPSHDSWGIKKIALMFCDDFLQTVYEMPWWHNEPSMRHAIQPIFDVLNLKDGRRVVRMLLASMPPGITIPVHHDTGEWVKHTHRVHVPIITNSDKVLFRVGNTVDTLQRILVDAGHVFEMNNQAKHAVSNHWDKYRVHLILDYVDESFEKLQRVKLSPGERLIQTRRSIDRELDAGKRKTPSYIILGAQKSGTTSLYDYLNQHPLVVRARRRETHCLDWRWNTNAKTTKSRLDHCHKFYFSDELRQHPSLLTGDSTPSYLVHSDLVIPRLKEVFPWDVKFFIMLRDPVKRTLSHFAMVNKQDGTPQQIKIRGTEWIKKGFEQVIAEDIMSMKKVGLIPHWKTPEGDDIYSCLKGTVDYDVFNEFHGSEAEDKAFSAYQRLIPMNTGSHTLLGRGLYSLQIRRWFSQFDNIPERFLVIKLEDMAGPGGIKNVVQRSFRHLGLPENVMLQDETPKNVRKYSDMSEDTRKLLQRFFDPYNQKLDEIIYWEKNSGCWCNPWPYNN